MAAVIGDLIYEGIKSYLDDSAYWRDSSEFLQRGLGLKSDVADALTAPKVNSEFWTTPTEITLAAAELQAYAKQCPVSPGNWCRS